MPRACVVLFGRGKIVPNHVVTRAYMVCVKSPPAVVPNVSVIQIGKVFHATK